VLSAKEACVKALSSLGGAPEHTLPDIEVVHGPAGQPRIRPRGRLGSWVRERHLAIEVLISHTGDMAGAVVVLLTRQAPDQQAPDQKAPTEQAPTEQAPSEQGGTQVMGHGDTPPETVEHTCQVALRSNDFDWAGHINNSVYPELLETGRWEWGRANGAHLRAGPLVAVVLQLSLDYIKAVDWDPLGRVAVRTSLAGLSPYSFTLDQDIEFPDGTLAARARVKLGLIHRETKAVHRVDLRALLNLPERVA